MKLLHCVESPSYFSGQVTAVQVVCLCYGGGEAYEASFHVQTLVKQNGSF